MMIVRSDATSWSITLESSVTFVVLLFRLLEDIYSTGHCAYDHEIMIVACLRYRPLDPII